MGACRGETVSRLHVCCIGKFPPLLLNVFIYLFIYFCNRRCSLKERMNGSQSGGRREVSHRPQLTWNHAESVDPAKVAFLHH